MAFVTELHQAGGRVYEVGGTVRDRLLGRSSKDRDLLVTGLKLEAITRILRREGEVFTVGKSFGVLKFRPKGEEETEFDIALPRKEVSTGAGHRDFQVDYDPSLPVEVDLSRRDFTINAMAIETATGKLIDPFGGEEDLKARTLRMVFDRAFEEDPLRLLRAVQFAARFKLTVEPKTLEAMKKNAASIRTVSPERVSEELRKLLLAERPSEGFVLMRDTGLLGPLLPELAENVGIEQGNKAHKDDVFLHTMKVLDASRKDDAIPLAGDLELMLAALFHDVGKARTQRFDAQKNRMTFYGHQILSKRMARKRMNHLKMTTLGIDPERVAHLVEHHMFQTKHHFNDRAIRRFINKVGPEHILKLVDLRIADNRGGKYPEGIKGVLRLRKKIQDELEKKTPFGVRDLAVSGTDLMDMGIPEGPEIGRILKELVEYVLDDPETNTKEALLDLAKKILEGKAPPRQKEEKDVFETDDVCEEGPEESKDG
jgi:putative nucleotidyltransferase with HDIG domain